MSADARLIETDRGDAGRRLDLVLQRHLGDVTAASRTLIQQWIQNGLVTVNGATVTRAARRTAYGDIVSVFLPDAARRSVMLPEDLPLEIVFEDQQMLVVNKPAGMVVHPTYRHPRGTLMNALLWRARGWKPGDRPSLVGRLDRDTSGAVVVAKTRAVHATLQRTLASPRSDKRYLAVVYGQVTAELGKIDLRLLRDEQDRRTVVASATAAGVTSQTLYKRLARISAPRVGLALLCCRLMTGRTHQIRVHLSARGWPIVGDAKYGKPLWSAIENPVLAAALQAFPRQALHAWRISLDHPLTRTRIDCEAPPPDDFRRLLEAIDFPSRDGTL
jgi:23S rRNA pseudouridine1911/1915/1917 synthase